MELEPETLVPVQHTYLWSKSIVQITQWFLIFIGPNRSGSGAKNF